jgi:hypothetical protein
MHSVKRVRKVVNGLVIGVPLFILAVGPVYP